MAMYREIKTCVVVSVDNYEKGEVKELEDVLPSWFNQQAISMKVNAGSKIRNLMTYALKKINVIIASLVGLFQVTLCGTFQCNSILSSAKYRLFEHLISSMLFSTGIFKTNLAVIWFSPKSMSL
jgi:uncharacterized membrane protein (Fun14 family)